MSPKKHIKEKKEAGKARRRNYDSAWKEVIEKLFENFLGFFFPGFHRAIDFSKKVDFLDTGMRPILPFNKEGDIAADVLVKVHLKNGTYTYICIFIHIEVQGQPLPDFMERMYIYNYRIFDKRSEPRVPVISAAILTDENPNFRPNIYEVAFDEFELRMKIPVVKIIDYKLKAEFIEKLAATANPMALVVRAQLKSMELNKADDNTKFSVAKELIRECYKQGYSRAELLTLMKFIEWVIRLPKDLETQLKEEITGIEEEFNMPYLASFERAAMAQGKKEGKLEGKKEGKLEGKLEGKKEGKLEQAFEAAKKMLKKGFDLDTIIEITGLNRKQIEKLA